MNAMQCNLWAALINLKAACKHGHNKSLAQSYLSHGIHHLDRVIDQIQGKSRIIGNVKEWT